MSGDKNTGSTPSMISANPVVNQRRLGSKILPQSQSDSFAVKLLLQNALDSNLNLQRELNKSLGIVHRKKTANRAASFGLLKKLAHSERLYTLDRSKGRHKRSWNQLYFTDNTNSIPEPNADSRRRQRWEGSEDLTCLTRPWSKAELALLKKMVQLVEKEHYEKNSHPTSIRDAEIDFNRVMLLMRQELSKSSKSHSQSTNDDDAHGDVPKLRSVTDYRNKYLTFLSTSLNHSPFTKAESLKILELVHKENGHPSWDQVAHTLNTNRSPFACFRHYQVKLNNKNSMTISSLDQSSSLSAVANPSAWTSEEDELLLKYIAASGPQTFINHRFAADVAIRFFPRMTVKQVFGRMTGTLVVPLYINERWSEPEERKLSLCMRIYCNTSSPIHEAALHFPQRAANSILVKWYRSLNPNFSTQPYTRQEDAALLEAVEEAGGAVNWKAVASKFPSRNSRSLYHRWTCLASKEDVLKRYEDAYIVKSIAKRGMADCGDENKLNPKEFVVGERKQNKNNG